MVRKILFFVIINCLYFPLFSQNQNLISTEIVDSALNRDINDIFQDSSGFIWVLTSDGMLRYDGRSFELFNFDPLAAPETTFTDSKFLSCAEDDEGILWAGTAGGLNCFDPLTFETSAVRNAPFGENSIEQVLYADALFILSGGSIYLKYPGEDSFEQLTGDYAVNVMAASPLKDTVYFADRRGILYTVFIKDHSYELRRADFSLNRNMSALCPALNSGKPFFIAGDINGFIYQYDENGNIRHRVQVPSAVHDIAHAGDEFILACGTGLYLFNPLNGAVRLLRDNGNDSYNTVYSASDGIVWAGGWNTGLLRFLPETPGLKRIPHRGGNASVMHNLFPSFALGDSLWTTDGEQEIIETSFSSNTVRRYAADTELLPRPNEPNTINAFIPLSEEIFAAGGSQGLFFFDSVEKTFELIQNEKVYSLLYDNDSSQPQYLWIGSDDVVIRYNLDDGSVERYPAGNGPIEYLFKDSKGRIWASSGEEGFYRFDTSGASFAYYGSDRYNLKLGKIVEDRDGVLWFRTDYSLFRYNEEQDRLDLLELPHPLVWDIYADPAGGVLIAGETGAYRYADNELVQLRGLEETPALSIMRDSRGSIWIGTYGGGLIKYDEGKEPTRYTVQDGLQSNTVYWTHEDHQGRIWIGCQQGLALYYQETDSLLSFPLHDFSSNDYFVQWGLNELTDDTFLVITRESSLFIDTTLVSASKKTYPFVITKLNAGGKDLTPAAWEQGIKLSWEERFADISFAVLDYSASDDIFYEYRFSENSPWNSLGRENRIVLAGLASGKHRLFLRAYSSLIENGIPKSQQLTFDITVSPPLWRSSFALILYALFFAALCFLAIKLYNQSWKIETVEMIAHNLLNNRLIVFPI